MCACVVHSQDVDLVDAVQGLVAGAKETLGAAVPRLLNALIISKIILLGTFPTRPEARMQAVDFIRCPEGASVPRADGGVTSPKRSSSTLSMATPCSMSCTR